MNLTDAQKSAVDHLDGHLQIIACAGSGKTEVISRRIANILQKKPHVSPGNIVAFTFTEKAAASLKRRIELALGTPVPEMYIGTIHGFCKHLLENHTDTFRDFKILDTVKNHLFVDRYAKTCGMVSLGLKPCMSNIKLFLECIDKLIDDYDNRLHWTERQQGVLEQYRDSLYGHNYIDFSLLLFEALEQIRSNDSVQTYLQSIQYLVVDEYQDVNDLQEKLIRSIADLGANVCVVGDDDQTIYQFRGSNADNMISFPQRYPGVYQVRLEENFRCREGIVDVASYVIDHNQRRLQKQMVSNKASIGTVAAQGYSNADAETFALAQEICRLHREGIPYKEIAVLCRKGKLIPPIAEVLAANGIPYTADSAEDFFNGDYFHRLLRTLDFLVDMDKAALSEQWTDIVDGTSFQMGFKYLRSCTRGGSWRLSEILSGFCEKIGFLSPDAMDLPIRKEELEGICKILDDYDEIYGDYQLSARIRDLLRFLALEAREEYKYHNFRERASEEDAVQLMTVHKSKGLEFHSVFIPRLNRREFPVSKMGGKKYYHVLGGTFEENKAKYDSDIEDERKLFYVAVTRAIENLFLSYTLDKQPISEFVSDAADSSFLRADRSELALYCKKDYDKELIKELREALYEYYSVGNHYCPGIILEYKDICRRGPDAIVAKTQELGMI